MKNKTQSVIVSYKADSKNLDVLKRKLTEVKKLLLDIKKLGVSIKITTL